MATDITDDYLLDLKKGTHLVEIGFCNIPRATAILNPRVMKKIKFTTLGRGEVSYGFDKVFGGLKIFSMKGNLRK